MFTNTDKQTKLIPAQCVEQFQLSHYRETPVVLLVFQIPSSLSFAPAQTFVRQDTGRGCAGPVDGNRNREASQTISPRANP